MSGIDEPIETIDASTIRRLVDLEERESETLEFKEQLPAKASRARQPSSGTSQIGEYARKRLLRELVGFANGFGGTLLVGIKESGESPRRAVGLSPLEGCEELAERIVLQARDCIEPRLPRVSARGVPLDSEGRGVVVVRVERSYLAPHRLRDDLQCYIRRGTSSEPMSMREIQDLTLRTVRGIGDLADAMAGRGEVFREFLADQGPVAGLRATAMPLWPVGGVSVDKAWLPRVVSGSLQRAGMREMSAHLPLAPELHPQPVLRGYARDWRPDNSATQEMVGDGRCEVWLWFTQGEPPQKASVEMDWCLGAVANVLRMVESFRQNAGTGPVEFVVQMELGHAGGRRVALQNPLSPVIGNWFDAAPIALPQLTVGGRDKFAEVLGRIWCDLLNSQKREAPGEGEFAFRFNDEF